MLKVVTQPISFSSIGGLTRESQPFLTSHIRRNLNLMIFVGEKLIMVISLS